MKNLPYLLKEIKLQSGERVCDMHIANMKGKEIRLGLESLLASGDIQVENSHQHFSSWMVVA